MRKYELVGGILKTEIYQGFFFAAETKITDLFLGKNNNKSKISYERQMELCFKSKQFNAIYFFMVTTKNSVAFIFTINKSPILTQKMSLI